MLRSITRGLLASQQRYATPLRLCSSSPSSPTPAEVNTTDNIPDLREKSINQVTLLGRVGADAEAKGTENTPVATFSLATTTTFMKHGEVSQNTVWHRVSVFRPGLRETVLRHVVKGSRVLVQGRLSYLERADPNNPGVSISSVGVVAHDVVQFRE